MSAQAIAKFRAKYPGYDDMSDSELGAKIVSRHPEYKDIFGDGAAPAQPAKPLTEGLFGTHIGENSPILEAARQPAQGIRDVGRKISDSFNPQSQSVVANAIANTPGTVADIGANVLANFAEPESIISEGALKLAGKVAPYTEPYIQGPIKSTAKWLGNQAERLSGLSHKQPGVLGKAVDDPGLILGAGRSASQKEYDVAKNASNIIRPEFKKIPKPDDVVMQTLEALDTRGITSQEALYARKMLDKSKNSFGEEFYSDARQRLDKVVKNDFTRADATHTKALQSEALRSVGSINKNGTAGQLRNAATLYKPYLAPLFSPMVQGGIASSIGLAGKAGEAAMQNPGLAGTLLSALNNQSRANRRDNNGK